MIIKAIVRGRLNTYHLDYDVETTSVLLHLYVRRRSETVYSIRLKENDSSIKMFRLYSSGDILLTLLLS